MPDCSEVNGLAQLALLNHVPSPRLVAARHAPVYDATRGPFEVPRAGEYRAWLKGSVRGSVALDVDGERVGEARHVLNEEGGLVRLGEVRLAAGPHRAELRFGGADLHPGSGGFPRPETGPLVFTPAGAEAGDLVAVPVAESSRLCGRPWDWVEVLGSG